MKVINRCRNRHPLLQQSRWTKSTKYKIDKLSRLAKLLFGKLS